MEFHPQSPTVNASQELPQEPLSLSAAVDLALARFPSIRLARARIEAAGAGEDLARTAYLPRIDLLWQGIRSTRNNISGAIFPQAVIPNLSGPSSNNHSDSAWGNAAGVLFSVEPFDFGWRGATLDVARAATRQAGAEADLTRLDVATAAIDAFLALVAAEQTRRAAQSNADRWEIFAKAVRVLVDKQLRPDVDASRAEAEWAAARNQLIQAEQLVEVGRTTLAETLGFTDVEIKIDPGPFLGAALQADLPPIDFSSHPALMRQLHAIDGIRFRQRALDSAYFPRVNLLGAFNERGSGFGNAGDRLDPNDGLVPDRLNWAAGVSLTFPALDIFQINARRHIEEGNERVERARMDQLFLNLKSQERRVRSLLKATRRIAENTPIQLKAAQDTNTRAQARYNAGLATLTDVADAQRLLAQSEIDDALARIAVWRSFAAAARVQGDARAFLDLVLTTQRERKK